MTYETMDNAQFEKALKGGQFDDELDRRTKANLERLGQKELPKAPATKPKVTVKTTTPKVPAKKATPTVKKAPSTTPKLDKLPRTTAPMPGRIPQILKDLKATNPAYGSDPAYGVNCVHVVNTWELRARGYDVSASRLPKHLMAQNGRGSQEALDRWRLSDGTAHGRDISSRYVGAQIKRLAEDLPEGGRAWVRVQWDAKYGGGGHIFSVEKIGGKLRWIDAQPGRTINIDEYIFKAKPGPAFGFARVDDLFPTDGVIEFIE
jgi:hypothetical protein